MIKGKHESKTITKHIAYKCKCKFDGTKCKINCGIATNVDVSVKNILYVKKSMFRILVHAFVGNGKVLWMIQWLRVMKL